jgi:hypothetical protein
VSYHNKNVAKMENMKQGLMLKASLHNKFMSL